MTCSFRLPSVEEPKTLTRVIGCYDDRIHDLLRQQLPKTLTRVIGCYDPCSARAAAVLMCPRP